MTGNLQAAENCINSLNLYLAIFTVSHSNKQQCLTVLEMQENRRKKSKMKTALISIHYQLLKIAFNES